MFTMHKPNIQVNHFGSLNPLPRFYQFVFDAAKIIWRQKELEKSMN